MAYALISAGSVSVGTTSVTPAFGQSTAGGHLLIACVATDNSASSITCSDGTWSKAVGAAFGGETHIWAKPNSGAGESAPQFTAASGAAIEAVLAEFSGGATSSPVDQTKTSGPVSSPFTVTMPGADAASGELLISSSLDLLSKAGTVTTSDSFNNGATATNLGNNDATSIASHYRFSYGITTGNSAADANTHSDNSMNLSQMTIILATFKLVAAATFIADSPFKSPSNAVRRAAYYCVAPLLLWKGHSSKGLLLPDLTVV